MTFLNSLLLTKTFGFFLIFSNKSGVSFGLYDIAKSLTIPGWAVVIILPLALIFGIIYLAAKIPKKTKLK